MAIGTRGGRQVQVNGDGYIQLLSMTGEAMEGFEEIFAEKSSLPKELLRDMLQLHELGKSYRRKQREINEIISRILM